MIDRSPARRNVLAAVGSGAVALIAGCSGVFGSSGDEDDLPLDCMDGYRHLAPDVADRSIVYADSDDPFLGFSLEISPRQVTTFEEFTVTLTNVSNRDLETYADDRFAIQAYGTEEWHTIFGVAEDYEWDDRVTTLSPGEERSWTITASIVDRWAETYTFCSTPTPGQYRFLYWGLPHEPQSDPLALVTEFTIVEQTDDENDDGGD